MIVNTPDMILFWQPDSIYSNWYPNTPLVLAEYPDIVFENSEAAFMYLKAKTFGDQIIAKLILQDQGPWNTKKLGRRINSYSEEAWAEVREDAMFAACYAKFAQNPKLKAELLATGTKLLVEASPVDKIWGIGLAPNEPKARNVETWQGLNLLGKILMEVRAALVNEMVRDYVGETIGS
jgi:ribA/ribD-fused uncharacterized protein